jgi:hypothetical protein
MFVDVGFGSDIFRSVNSKTRLLNNAKNAARAKTQSRKLILKKNLRASVAWREMIFQMSQNVKSILLLALSVPLRFKLSFG